MRILFVLHQFYPEYSAGTERVALALAHAAQRAGHYVHVISCKVKPDPENDQASGDLIGALHTVHDGIPVTLLPRSLLSDNADSSFEISPELIDPLVAWLKLKHFDLAHALHPMRMSSVLLAVQRSALPYLFTLTDFFAPCFLVNFVNLGGMPCAGAKGGAQCAKDCLVSPWTSESLATRYQQANGILAAASMRVCPSEFVARRYREEFPELDFRVIPHGIDFLATVPKDEGTGQQNRDGITFGFVGSIVKQKGLDTLLEAFARIPDPSVRLRVVGGFYGEPVYVENVRRLAAADKRVEFLGQLSSEDVWKELRAFDVICIPSRVPESFSLVLREAAVAGVPAMVSASGAPAEFVAAHECGQSLPAGDVAAWTTAMLDLLGNREILEKWRHNLPLPLRVEEESFFYEQLYMQLQAPR